MTKIVILGGGSWGTALGIVLSHSRRAHPIALWIRDPALAESLQKKRENEIYLPGIAVPASVAVTNDIEKSVADATILVGAIPSAHARGVYCQALPYLSREIVFVSATKGLEPSTHLRMSEVIGEVVAPKFTPRIAILSGPSFAAEAARGEPTAAVIASSDAALASLVQEEFASPSFRLYTNDDVLGVELAAAMKNVIAIAAGACQGLGLGANSLAALITRGLAEMTRLAVALGAKSETLSGLAGLGDLVLTCYGALSRNRYVGVELSKGRPLNEILAGMRMVAEGVGTAKALLTLAENHGISLPITEQVNAILHQGKLPRDAIRDIMDRPLKRE